ncbi:MAG: siphovirus Gp157 family protein [Kiritimatiellaceae bacterium]|nr:siphovirus Gp157 family protein [Kiritimatiellaceae bacterium]
MSKHLYELTGNLAELQKLAEMDSSETTQEAVAETMNLIEGDFKEKAKNLTMVLLNMDGDTEAIDTEIARLQERKKIITNRKDSLKEYLRLNMEASGIKKIECPLFVITCAAGRDIVKIEDEDKIPDAYVQVTTTIKPLKREILDEFKAGRPVPGCDVVKSKSSIRIK